MAPPPVDVEFQQALRKSAVAYAAYRQGGPRRSVSEEMDALKRAVVALAEANEEAHERMVKMLEDHPAPIYTGW